MHWDLVPLQPLDKTAGLGFAEPGLDSFITCSSKPSAD